ncbi:MAG: carboxypeptidase-like regulatory domain-containing protein [Bacteroidota bacterium]
MKYFFLALGFLFTIQFSAQTLSGKVTGEFDDPLHGANLILLPSDEKKEVQFTSSQQNGQFSFDVAAGKYQLKVNFLGYKSFEKDISIEKENNINLNIQLQPKVDELTEVVIDYQYQPIQAKLDTLVVDVQAFSQGNERKLKELLNKVPGLEVDKNGLIRLNGKPVQHFLVENKLFFGGGSKLGVENIPADAVKQIELLDNFTEVNFLKDVLNTDELALNVILKDDKKKLWFGDVELGLGNRNYRDAHTAIFYYSASETFNLIADHNTYGKAALGQDDIMRFLGNKSQFALTTNNLNTSNAAMFSMGENKMEVVETQAEITALNYTKDFDKTDINTYLIANQTNDETFKNELITYLQDNTQENRNTRTRDKAFSGLGSFQLNYKRDKNTRLKYQIDGNFSVSENTYFQESNFNSNEVQINKQMETDYYDISQFLEYHLSYSAKRKSTFVVNSNISQTDPFSLYESSQPILPNQISLIQDDTYFIEQVKKINNQEHQIRYKLYQVLGKNWHINFDVGNVFQYSNFRSNEAQILSNGDENSLEDQGFGNHVDYTLNNAFVGAELRFKIGKLINKPALNFHYYYFKNSQTESKIQQNQLLFEPRWNSQINFTKTQKLSFDYTWNNQFPRPDLVANRFQLQQFNLIFRGNELLQEQRFHNFRLNFRNFNYNKGLNYFASLYFNRKTKVLRNQVMAEGINQFLSPEIRNTPENYYGGVFHISKKIGFFEPFVSPDFSVSDYSQLINNEDVSSIRKRQSIETGIRLRKENLPFVKLSYEKSFQQFRGITTADFETDKIEFSLDYSFATNWNLVTEFTYFKNKQLDGFEEDFNFLDLKLNYQKENSPWILSLLVNNALDVRSISRNQFSDFLTTEKTNFVLPRMLMFKIGYSF